MSLPREYVLSAILKTLNEVEREHKFGCLSISYKAGMFQTIKQEEVIASDEKSRNNGKQKQT